MTDARNYGICRLELALRRAGSAMSETRYSSKAIYYGGYPGSSGKPVAGRLRWRGGILSFVPNASDSKALQFDRGRLLGVRRSEEGLTGARRLRLLVDVEADDKATATLKFEMGGLWWKERKLAYWLDVLGAVCRERIAGKMPAPPKDEHV